MMAGRCGANAVELLEPYRAAGVLVWSDVHTAAALARLTGVTDPAAILATALAARAPRHGHVCIDLRTAADLIAAETEADTAGDAVPAARRLEWPEPSSWLDRVGASALVSQPNAPLVVAGGLLYLERYHRYERSVAEQLLARADRTAEAIPLDVEVTDALLTGDGSDRQRDVVAAALRRPLTVLVGGPGTGKTTTVAALLATLLRAQPGLHVALAAPTGKAAARLGDAIGSVALHLPLDLAARVRDARSETIHRLLGSSWGSSTFRHDRRRPLPHDVVIVDETSMVSLPLMARLLDAVRPDARVVLVGDPGQLTSVDAGSVLGDIAGPAIEHPGARGPLASSVAELHHSRRFPAGSSLDRLAHAVRTGDAGAAIAVLAGAEAGGSSAGAATWLAARADAPDAVELVRSIVEPAALEIQRLASEGDAVGALAAIERVRLLCAHRRGPFGVEPWNRRVEEWLAAAGVPSAGWYAGRPVLVTANDYRLNLFNGDLGVVTAGSGRPAIAFADRDGVREVSPAALEAVDTVHAMTVHKSQGSEFDDVVVILPSADSRLATRELLYTAITRARRSATVVGTEEAIAATIGRRTVRSSGLRRQLWPAG